MVLKRFACLAAVSFLFLNAACHDVSFVSRVGPGEIGIYDDLYSVSAPGDDLVVTVGYFGSIFTSEDDGDHWTRRESGTQVSLYAVEMADSKHGWIIGQLGTILRTEDGGKTWTSQDNPKKHEGSHLFGLYVIDANTALAIGEWGSVVYTDDGGRVWQDRSFLIHEKHPMFVWLAPTQQQRVRDGGRVYEDVGLNDVLCLDGSAYCWIIGEFGSIWRSEDHFKTFEKAQIVGRIGVDPIPFGSFGVDVGQESEAALRAFVGRIVDQPHLKVEIFPFANKRERAKLGNEDDPFEIFDLLEGRGESVRSILEEEGILSDRIRMRGSPPWDYEDFIGEDPEFLTRYLDGRTGPKPEVVVGVLQNPYLFKIFFEDENMGIIAGLGGVILFSEDGGLNWDYAPTDTKRAFYAVNKIGGRLLTVGEKGTVRISQDGGRQWAVPTSGFPSVFTYMRDLSISPGEESGFIVGQEGLVLRTLDRGLNWKVVLSKRDSS